MAKENVTRRAADCADCGLVKLPRSNPGTVLDRLPPSLFNLTRPAREWAPGALFDEGRFDVDAFDEVPVSDDVTPQYELARLFAREKDAFLLAWREAEIEQLGLGRLDENDGLVSGEGLRARGADLDKLGTQYGIGRPLGFTDCCYWKLVQLICFTAGPTLWRLLEIAELYTGIRPQALESPCLISLAWPLALDGTVWGANVEVPNVDYGAWNADFLWSGAPTAADNADDWVWIRAADATPDSGAAAWRSGLPLLPPGLTLLHALGLVKPAGVVVQLLNPPLLGRSGCYGATLRGPQDWRGRWRQGTEDGI